MTKIVLIFHIAHSDNIPEKGNSEDYRCESLSTEGFIHCCSQAQLAGVVNRYYQDINDVYLLCIDVDKLEAAVILESTAGGAELFPHVYGPINHTAITDVIPFGIHSTERLGILE